MTIDAFKGAEGYTLTGGTEAYFSLIAGSARSYIINTGNVVLPKGASIGINVIPQASNSSMDIQIFLSITEDEV